MADGGTSTMPWTATVTASLSRVLLDMIEEINYEDGRFLATSHPVTGPRGIPTEMNCEALQNLAKELRAEVDQPPGDVDLAALRAFLALIPE